MHNLVELDPRTGSLRILDSWTLDTGREILTRIEALLPNLTGDTVVLDFYSVRQLDSSGISDLIQLNLKLRDLKKRLEIVQTNAGIKLAARVVHLDRLLTLRD